MSSDEEETSLVIVDVEGVRRLGESLFLEVEKPTMGRLQLMRRGVLPGPSN